jgi:two-component system, OmpR family, phosphate regulon sensor histidine kinase PhoR
LSRKAIISLLILMSTALLGLTLIQAYWINWSVKLNREKLDKNIYDALNDVADRLRQRELNTLFNKFSEKDNSNTDLSWSDDQDVNLNELLSSMQKQNPETNVEANLQAATLESMLIRLNRQPLIERVDIEALKRYIGQELRNRGIDLEYHYAVLSNANNAIVVLDGYYVFEEESPSVVSEPNEMSLIQSPYKVELFKDADRLESSGQLAIFFPQLNREIWNTLWGTLLGSLIFTGLILFCFIYALNIVFKQKKLSEMKTDFINNMTHEFKTPIATISLAAESITSEKVIHTPENILRYVRIIRQENERMLNQVEQVLQIAQLEKETLNLDKAPLDMHHMLQSAVEQISVQIDHREGQLRTNFMAGDARILGDQVHMENIVFNLLDNAIKYSKDSPVIDISTRNSGGFIDIEFKDQGIGISKEQKKYIFDKFYRVHTGNVHDVKGFGLGLSYVKAMVEAHGGHIEVLSEPGSGSSFIVHLPLETLANGA